MFLLVISALCRRERFLDTNRKVPKEWSFHKLDAPVARPTGKEYQGIRIKYDISLLEDRRDTRCCFATTRELLNGKVCVPAMVVERHTTAKLRVACRHAADFFRRFLQVIPYNRTIQVPKLKGVPIPSKHVKNCDLHVTITAPYEDAMHMMFLSNSLPTGYDPNVENRPVAGYMSMNSVMINALPLEKLTRGILHETMHLLGIHPRLYEFWKDPGTGKPYGETFPMYRYVPKRKGKNWTILATPNARKLAEKQFGTKEFWEGVPAGIVMDESFGGSLRMEVGHVKPTVFNDDIMTPCLMYGMKITRAVVAMLKDTGWYKVNESLMEPEVYLFPDKFFGGKKTDKAFAIGPPQKSLPREYYSLSPNERRCSPDMDRQISPIRGHEPFPIDCTRDSRHPACIDKRYFAPVNDYVDKDSPSSDYMDLGVWRADCMDMSRSFGFADKVSIYGRNQSMCFNTLRYGEKSASCMVVQCYQNGNDTFYGFTMNVRGQNVEAFVHDQNNNTEFGLTRKLTIFTPPAAIVCPLLSQRLKPPGIFEEDLFVKTVRAEEEDPVDSFESQFDDTEDKFKPKTRVALLFCAILIAAFAIHRRFASTDSYVAAKAPQDKPILSEL